MKIYNLTLLFILSLILAGSARNIIYAKPAEKKKPNIVFILADDMGWADLSCYGNQFNEAPNLEKLASEGMRFTNAYAACPVCSPTRASLISGQYPARVGITDFLPGHWRPYEKVTVPTNRTQYLPLEIETIAEQLKKAGYTTGMFGKWHLGFPEKYAPNHQGFDEAVIHRGRHFGPNRSFLPEQDVPDSVYLTEFLTDKSLDFMERHKDGPFFLYLSHFAVHIPLEAEQELIEKYKKKPKPDSGVNNPIYAAMVEHVDQSVGRIMQKLDELGIRENTLLVFFSDNGGLRQIFNKSDDVIVTSNAPLRDEKGTLYEGGIREPLIVSWPGKVKAGTESGALVSSVDFYPTFLEVAGGNLPDKQVIDGTSFLPALNGKDLNPGRAVYWHYPHYHHSVPGGAIRKNNWKLIEFYDDGYLELYNLAEDIGETKNVAQQNPKVTAKMKKQLDQWRKEVGAEMPQPNPDFDPEKRFVWGKHPDRDKIFQEE